MNVGILGHGYWGVRVTKALDSLYNEKFKILSICDLDSKKLEGLSGVDLQTTTREESLFNNQDVDLIFILTEPYKHYEQAKKALQCGKNVFVEKPLSLSFGQYKKLEELASDKGLLLLTSHIYQYSSGFEKLKKMLSKKLIGEVKKVETTRNNYGRFYPNSNIIHDLCYHDLYIMDQLFPNFFEKHKKLCLSATYYQPEAMDCRIQMQSLDDVKFIFNSSNFHPKKIRETIITGDKGMILWDDCNKVVDCYLTPQPPKNEILIEKVETFMYSEENTLVKMLKDLFRCPQQFKNKQNNLPKILEATDLLSKKLEEVNNCA